jgi:hypothetical protein
MPDAAFYLLATETVSTKRLPPMVGGKRGAPALHLAGLSCTPLDPVTENTLNRLRLNTPHTLRECYMESGDVVKGDLLVLGERDYPIREVEARTWPGDGSRYLHLVVEALER